MLKRVYRADLLLLAAAVIWGCAFAFQRQAAEELSTYSIIAIRFTLGTICLLPFVLRSLRRKPACQMPAVSPWVMFGGTILAGAVLFAGASFQQWGMEDTSAGKAGFITGLYVVMVPLLGLVRRQRPGWGCWAGVTLSVVGLYFLSMSGEMTFASGDAKVLIGAVIWALHIQVLGWLSPRCNVLHLAFGQYAVCGILGLAGMVMTVQFPAIEAISSCLVSLLYLGAVSTALGFTLQALGQKESPATHAAIIMSLEAVFAALAGWCVLGELLSVRETAGCVLMMIGMLVSQLLRRKIETPSSRPVTIE